MKSYQQLNLKSSTDNTGGSYVPKVQISLVKEVYVSNTSYRCSEEIAQSEIAEKELRHSDREKFICIHFNIRNQIISYEVVSAERQSGKIFDKKVGRSWRILRREVERFLSEQDGSFYQMTLNSEAQK